MWKFFLPLKVGIALVALAACQTAPTSTPRALSLNLRAGNRLIIATNEAYPPYSAVVPNATRPAQTACAPNELTADELSGFDVAVGVALAEQLALEPCFVFAEWERMIGGYWDADWDVAAASISITPQRLTNLWFSQPYSAVGAQFFVRQNAPWQQASDLDNAQIATCSGCTYDDYLRGTLELTGQEVTVTVRNPVVVAYSHENDMLAALVNNPAIQAALTSPAFGQGAIRAGQPIRPLGEPVFYEYIGVALDRRRPNDNGALALAVHEAIRALHADGTLRRLALTFLGDDVTAQAARFDPALLNLPHP